jgi:hypothetical protein
LAHDTRSADPTAPALTTHRGSCHCGAVRFQAELDLSKGGSRCNCSICTKIASTGGIIAPAAFTLLEGEDQLGVYVWGSQTSKRFFCRSCGVHVFGRGHLDVLGGDFVSVNFNCLDDVDVATLPLIHWDGRHNNWQAGPRPTPWPRFSAEDRAA